MMRGLGLSDADAVPLLREIVDEDATQVEAGLMLAAILERTGTRDELADLLVRQIDAAKDRGDAATIVSLALRLGALLEQTDRMQARNVYYTGLDWEPAGRGLLDALVRLLDGDGEAAERADLLERRLAVEQGPAAEEMAMSLACGADGARRRGGGGARHRARVPRVPGERGAPRPPGGGVPRAASEWRKLAELCVLDASARVDLGDRVSRLREAAVLWRTELGLPREAAEALRMARRAAPEDGSILRELVDLLVEAGEYAGAVAELTAAIEVLAVGDRARGDLFAARAAVRSAVDRRLATRRPRGPRVRDRDGTRIARGAARRGSSSTSARPRRRRGDVARARAAAPPGPGDAVRRGYRDGTDNPRGARATGREGRRAALRGSWRAWRCRSSAGTRRARCCGVWWAWRRETPRWRRRCVWRTPASARAAPGDARGALERARLVAPEDRAVRERLERVYEQTGAWHELADLALEDARGSGDVAERFALLLRAGALRFERAGDAVSAVDPLTEAHALRPADPDCVALLADANLGSGRAEEALALIDQIIAS